MKTKHSKAVKINNMENMANLSLKQLKSIYILTESDVDSCFGIMSVDM